MDQVFWQAASASNSSTDATTGSTSANGTTFAICPQSPLQHIHAHTYVAAATIKLGRSIYFDALVEAKEYLNPSV